MLQHLVANWLRQQAQEAVMQGLNPKSSESDESGEPPPPRECAIVCLFPSSSEAGGFTDQLTSVSSNQCVGFVERIGELNGTTIGIIESSLTHEPLARVLHDVIQLRKPKWVIASGFAIALEADVKRGEMIVADRLIDQQEYSLTTGVQMPESRGVRVGTMLTVTQLPTTTEARKKLQSLGAIACESQAAIVAEVCRAMKTRMMSIHCIAQGLEQHKPKTVKKVQSQESLAGLLGAAAGAILEKPSSIKDFWNDKEASLRSSDRLATFLVSIITQL